MSQSKESKTIKGPNFSEKPTMGLKDFLEIYNPEKPHTMGGQTTAVEQGIDIINQVLALRADKSKPQPTIFFGYTSNVVSSGLREVLAFLCQHKLVDVMVSTGGGLEEDFMKTMNDSYVMDYLVNDRKWRTEGKNRIGNMVVPNDSYTMFEDMLTPILDELYEEQKKYTEGGCVDPDYKFTTASSLIQKLGEKLASQGEFKNSIYYWCQKHKIPVFCPGVTDSAIGDVCYFNSFKNDKMIIDLNADLTRIMDIACESKGPLVGIFLGGGMIKYHILNACKMAGGLDYGVFITTGNDWDGSNSGAQPGQDVSRRAIKPTAKTVVIKSDVTLVFPIIAASTFVKHVFTVGTDEEEETQDQNENDQGVTEEVTAEN
jgi:deoxyhypusine synthase